MIFILNVSLKKEKIMKRFKFLIAILLLFCTPLFAKLHDVSDADLAEIKENIAVFKASPNAEHRFELAMSFGKSGFIEEGWKILEELPPEYAQKVIEKYERLTQKDPDNWENYFKLAFGYYFVDEKHKEFDRALGAFDKVLELNPNHVWTMGFISLIKGVQKEYDVAIDWANKALKIEPNAMAIHALLALGYQKKGKNWQALKHTMVVGRLKTESVVAGYNFDI